MNPIHVSPMVYDFCKQKYLDLKLLTSHHDCLEETGIESGHQCARQEHLVGPQSYCSLDQCFQMFCNLKDKGVFYTNY